MSLDRHPCALLVHFRRHGDEGTVLAATGDLLIDQLDDWGWTWLVFVLGLFTGALVGQLWRLLTLLVVLAAVTGCRDSWRIEHWEGEDRACRAPGGFAANPQNCFPCRTTDFVDARRVCDAAGIRKAGAK